MHWDVSLFRTQKDNQPHGNRWGFDDLCEFLRRKRPRPAEKDHLPLWSPTVYRQGATRGKAGVVSLSCLVLDYDSGVTIEDTWELWADWTRILHTSWSHAPAHHKFRLVLPLARPVEAANWPAVFKWAQDRTQKAIDPACKDQGRVYYLSCDGPDFRGIVDDGPAFLDLSHLRWQPVVERPPLPATYRYRPSAEYDVDPASRERAGLQLGGRRRGDDIIDVRCPMCGVNKVYWHIYPRTFTGWMCKRRDKCGATGSIRYLLEGK